jgi:hypothetical protein
MRSPLLMPIIICAILGAAGGLVVTLIVPSSPVVNILLGSLYGLLFALLAGARAISPGAGLLWGLGYAFILWLAIPAGIVPVLMGGMPSMGMLDTARAHFPELVAYTLGFGSIRVSQLLVGHGRWWWADWPGWLAAGRSANGWRRSISSRSSPG